MKTCLGIVASLLLFSGLVAGEERPAAPPSEIPAIIPPARETGGEGEKGEKGEEGKERDRDEIETDRDSVTPAIKTVGRRRLVVESAYTFFDNRGRAVTHSYPEFLARYGITDRLEVRLGWNYEVGGAENGEGLERESVLNLGLKGYINEQRCWVPESSFILTALVPTSGAETATQFFGTYAFGWELPNRWKLDAALRYGTDTFEADHFSDWAPSIVVKAPIGEKCNAHVEYFGTFRNGKEQDEVRHYISPGVHYLITPDFEVGIRLGWGLNDQSSRFFSNVGFGYRF